MLDIFLLRKEIDKVATLLAQRAYTLDSAAFNRLEMQRKTLQMNTEALQAQRNALSKQIGINKAKGVDSTDLMSEVSVLGEELKQKAQVLTELQKSLSDFLLSIPNVPDASVPVGKSEADNCEVRRFGAPPVFDFPIKDHVDLGLNLGIDFAAAIKLSGSRFVVLKGQVARLHRALAQFMLDTHTLKHQYTEVAVPYIVNVTSMIGTGQLPKFESDLFKIQHRVDATEQADQHGAAAETFYLIPTAEVPLTNLVRDTLIASDQLPLKYVAYTPCFRSEAGSYGKDMRGMIRHHQFDKVELVHIVHPEQAQSAFDELVKNAEAILHALELPFRTVALCTADLGFASEKTYDLEVWLPAQNTYREISSCSSMGAFQARRMQARYRTMLGKNEYVYTLNGSGLAIGRTLVAILENYQNADGSVTIPKVLQPYMRGIMQLTPQFVEGK